MGMEPITLDDPTGRSRLRFAITNVRPYPTLSIICNFEQVRYGVDGYHTAMQLLLTPEAARETLRQLQRSSFVSIQGDLMRHGHLEYELNDRDHAFSVYTPNSKRAFRRYQLGHPQNVLTIAGRLLDALDAATPEPAPAASAPKVETPIPTPSPKPANDLDWRDRRIAELEQAVKERDQMIAFLRQQQGARQ